MTWALDGIPLHSILVTRLRYLGDVVMSTVVPEILKLGDPSLHVGFLCESPYDQVLRGHPSVDQVFCLEAPQQKFNSMTRKAHPHDVRQGGGAWDVIRSLRRAKFGLALDLFFNPRSALVLKGSGIRARIGGTSSLRRHLYTHCVQRQDAGKFEEVLTRLAPGGLGDHLCRMTPLRHLESDSSFGDWLGRLTLAHPLLPVLPKPRLSPEVGNLLAGLGDRMESPFLVLAPGATWSAKEWPQRRWRVLLEHLLVERRENLVVLLPPGGNSQWVELGQVIPAPRGGVLPTLALGTVMEVLAQARGVISTDGGIMHCAVGLGIPTLALFGPTQAEIWFPYGHDSRFKVLGRRPPCHPCHLHDCEAFSCLPDIRPGEVMTALAGILGEV